MTRWTSRHLHLATGAVTALDRVVQQVVAPAAAETGRPWFFMRYWQSGPHVRLRVADLAPDEAAGLTARLEDLMVRHAAPVGGETPIDPDVYAAEAARQARGETGENRRVAALLAPGVHEATYEPEVERYGGADVMAASEALFVRSSRLVLDLLPSAPDLASRRRIALRVAQAAASTLGPPPAQAVFHEIGRRSWAAWARAYGVDPVATSRPPSRSLDPAAFTVGPEWVAGWRDDVAEVVAALGRAGTSVPGPVVSSHVHMTHNRLGLGILDELRTYTLLAATFPAAEGSVPDLGPLVPA